MAIKLKFTQAKIREIPFSDTQVDYQDTETPHLFLRVGKKTKTFFYLRRVEGVLKKKALSSMTLEEAKKEVSALDGDVARSKSILTAAERDITLQEALDYYIHIKRPKTSIGYFLAYVSDYLQKPLKNLSKVILKDIVDRIVRDGKIATSNALLGYLSAIINLAIKDDLYSGVNPTFGIKKIPVDPRRVVLQKNGIEDILKEIERMRDTRNSDALDAIKILIYTGQRKMNVLSMEWKEISFITNTWVIPAQKFKGRRTHEVLLSKHAAELLKHRKEKSTSIFVFPVHRENAKVPHMTEIKKTFSTLKNRLNVSDLRIHDLRRSYGSLLLNEGVPIEVVSKVLGHSSISVTERVYALVNRQSLQKAKDVFDSVLGNY